MENVIISTQIELANLIEESLKKVLLETQIGKDENNRLPELLNVKQAANYLNLAPQTLYGFTSNRKIPFIKKGKKLYFKKDDLEKWLSDGRKKTVEELETDFNIKEKGEKHG